MIAIDSSLVVAGFAPWHEGFEPARRALRRRPRLPAHVAMETYAVLTRLPGALRASGDVVAAYIAGWFEEPFLTLDGTAHAELLEIAASRSVEGGGLYDALVAETAKRADAVLLTRDHRARSTYDLIGAAWELVD